MGKKTRLIIGLGLALAGGAIFAGNFFAIGGVAISYASVASLVGLSLLGSALAPDISDMFGADSYSGMKLQTRKDNTSAVPVVYGFNKLAGNIIWQQTNNKVSINSSANGYNRDYWAIYSMAGHSIEDITTIYANTLALTDKGSNIFTSGYTHIKWYNASSSTTNLNDISFVKTESGTTETYGNLLVEFVETQLTLSNDNTTTNRGNLLDRTDSSWGISGGAGSIDINLGAVGSLINIRFHFKQYDDTSNYIYYNLKLQYYNTGSSSWVDTGDTNNNQVFQQFGVPYSEFRTVSLSNTLAEEHQSWRVVIISVSAHVAEIFVNSSVSVDVDIPKDIAYLAVHQVFDGQDNKNTEFDNILVDLEGKKIRAISSSGFGAVAYSNNPAEIIADLLTDGLVINDSNIDIASFNQARIDCAANSWTCNIAFIQQANIQSVINDVLSTCRGQITHSGDKWKLKIDQKSQTSITTITDDDIINNSLNISMAGNQEISNKITIKYINPADEWLSAQATIEDTTLQDWDGQVIEKMLDIKGITNTAQALQLAEITLNSMRYSEDSSGNRVKQTPLRLSFSTTVKNAHLEVGDVISVDHDVLDRVRKFVILSTENDQSGLIQVSTREYAEQHYKDSSGNYLI